jgi:hypothetical protein
MTVDNSLALDISMKQIVEAEQVESPKNRDTAHFH